MKRSLSPIIAIMLLTGLATPDVQADETVKRCSADPAQAEARRFACANREERNQLIGQATTEIYNRFGYLTNRQRSERIGALLQERLGIPPERVYLGFTRVSAENWGWKGTTFG